MKIVVCVKQVAVVDDEISFADDGRLAPESVDLALNEWDACAVEEGLLIRDAASSGEVLAVTVGPPSARDALVRCLAMGCDRATRVDADDVVDPLDPIALAHALAEVVRDEKPELVLCGAQSSDAGHGATGTALAELLGLARVAVAKRIDYSHADWWLLAHRELEGGLVDVVDVDLPALVTVQTTVRQSPRNQAGGADAH